MGSYACYDFLAMPFSILVGRQGARLKIFSPWKPQEWTTCPTTICEDHARPRATSRGQVMAAQGLVYGRRLQHRIICSQPFQRGARSIASCRCGAKPDVQRVDCIKGYEHRKTNTTSRKEEPGHFAVSCAGAYAASEGRKRIMDGFNANGEMHETR